MRILTMTATVSALLLCAAQAGCGRDEAQGSGRVAEVAGKDEFAARVLRADKPVLVDFSAAWCGPCKRLEPIIHDLAEEYNGRAEFVKIDIDESAELAGEYGIEAVPTVLIFSGGEVVSRLRGLRGPQAYRSALEGAMEGT